jgi:hypothetical protein
MMRPTSTMPPPTSRSGSAHGVDVSLGQVREISWAPGASPSVPMTNAVRSACSSKSSVTVPSPDSVDSHRSEPPGAGTVASSSGSTSWASSPS